MLARKQNLNIADFEASLVVPPKPADIQAAEDAWRRAVAEREAGQRRHIDADRAYHAQRPGEVQTLTRADVDAIGAELQGLFAAEKEASAARDAAKVAYEASLHAALAGPMEAYREAISERLNELDELLAVGCMLNQRAAAANVKLPSTVASVCPALLEHGTQMARKILARVR